ncbi:nitroreductase [Thermodesulfobacteriota bacterium]
MKISETIRSRKSVRAFKPDPVSKNVLGEILETAVRAPSAMNTQPWEFIVVGGDVLDKVKKANGEKLASGVMPHSEHNVVGWGNDTVYRKRQVDLAIQIFQLMDIQREDKEKRGQWMARGFRYFDAPATIVIVTDRVLEESAPLLDLGAVMQNICLAALDHGLGTCIEDQGVMYPEVLRECCGIPDEKRIIIAIAVGYPDQDFPANKLESPRETVESITTWCGFD